VCGKVRLLQEALNVRAEKEDKKVESYWMAVFNAWDEALITVQKEQVQICICFTSVHCNGLSFQTILEGMATGPMVEKQREDLKWLEGWVHYPVLRISNTPFPLLRLIFVTLNHIPPPSSPKIH
jgi:hypothetical protein